MAAISMDAPVSRVTKIAQSDGWTTAQRLMVVIGIPALLAVGGVMLNEIIQDGKEVASHTTDITAIKQGVDELKKQDSTDHDWLTQLKTEVEGPQGLIAQIQKLWERPQKPPPP